ncbi:MAG: MmcQ/YjbR family DNA-binding protein [Lysobacter sp.]|nr:MmcQ/YjbR family DNA-binding protein [Lysobacter sp.]
MTTRKRMDVAAVKAHCAALPGATIKLFDDPMNVLSCKVDGKTFAYFKTSEPERWRFSVRVTPERFLELTSVPGIKPARYMARYHWVTIVDVRTVPPSHLRELIAWSYDHALRGLSKRVQAGIASVSGVKGVNRHGNAQDRA